MKELTASEAFVLLKFLSRFSNDDIFRMEERAEERGHWNLCASFESILAEPFTDNYYDLLAKARGEGRHPVS